MSFNGYGYNVYKKNQVSLGNPYAVQHPQEQAQRREPRHAGSEAFEEGIHGVTREETAADIVARAQEEAELIRKEAEFEAQRMMDEAAETIAVRTAEALQKAKEEGYRNGESLARQHYEELIDEARQLRDQAESEYNGTMDALESDMVHMVLNIARKVLGAELRQNPETILHLVRDAVLACSNREHVVLKVSAEDYDYLCDCEERLRALVPGLHEVSIRREPSLARGACLVDTGFGIADGSAEEKFQAVERAFLELMNERSAARRAEGGLPDASGDEDGEAGGMR